MATTAMTRTMTTAAAASTTSTTAILSHLLPKRLFSTTNQPRISNLLFPLRRQSLTSLTSHSLHLITTTTKINTRFTTIRASSYSPLNSKSNFSDRPPTEMAPLFPGCDYMHWLIVMDKPGGEGATKQQMIDCYIQTLAKVVGSEEDAKRLIYNVSCERYFGFGCELDEETSNKLEGLPGVLFVLPDSYVDPENKDYGETTCIIYGACSFLSNHHQLSSPELLVNGEIVQRSPERQRRVDPVPQRGQDRGKYGGDRTRYVRRRENMR